MSLITNSKSLSPIDIGGGYLGDKKIYDTGIILVKDGVIKQGNYSNNSYNVNGTNSVIYSYDEFSLSGLQYTGRINISYENRYNGMGDQSNAYYYTYLRVNLPTNLQNKTYKVSVKANWSGTLSLSASRKCSDNAIWATFLEISGYAGQGQTNTISIPSVVEFTKNLSATTYIDIPIIYARFYTTCNGIVTISSTNGSSISIRDVILEKV